jgi:glucose-1-phosphate adenylyltransferase
VAGLGLMQIKDDHSITRFVEKPKDPEVIQSLTLSAALESELATPSTEKRCLASMGIYVFNRSVLADALSGPQTDFGKEIIPGLLGQKKLFAHIFEGYWEDIGTVRAFFDANLALAQPQPPFDFFDAVDPIYTGPLPARREAQHVRHRPCGHRRRFNHHGFISAALRTRRPKFYR